MHVRIRGGPARETGPAYPTKLRAGPIRARLKEWLDGERTKHPPKSPLGVAIRYALGQWKELGVFLEDARVPLDNNASERALRRLEGLL